MIKRTSSKTSSSVVNAAQSETITATMGIKTNAPVSDLASATNITNFNINTDGTLTLRDPLIYTTSPTSAIVYRYIFDNVRQLKITKPSIYEDSLNICLENSDGTEEQVFFRYTTYTGKVIDELFTKPIITNWEECEFLDTASSTIIAKALVNLTLLPDTYNPKILNSPTKVFRYLNLFFDSVKKIWVVELLSPEVNTIITSNNSFDANVSLDNIYATRDLYNYGKASVTGILPYMQKDIPSEVTYTLLKSKTVDVSPFQGLFGFSIKKDSKTNTTNVLVRTKVPMAFVDVQSIYEKPNSQSTIEKFFKDISDGHEIKITINTSTGSINSVSCQCGYFVPANTTLVLKSIEGLVDISQISIEMPKSSVYCYPIGTDFEVFKDITATKILLGSDAYTVTIQENLWDGTQDLNTISLIDVGLDIEYRETQFHLVKAHNLSTVSYIRCVKSTEYVPGYADPNYFTYGASYGTFTSKSTFYVYLYDSNVNFSSVLNSLTVQELTENVNNIQFQLIDTFNDKESRPILLKAFVTTPSNSSLEYYCNWEESTDGGLTWHIASQFLDKFKHNIKYVPKDVLNRSNETLENADDYLTYVEVVPFNISSEQDKVETRPDVLPILNFDTSKRFRFNIYYDNNISEADNIDLPGFSTTVSLHGSTLGFPKHDNWYILSQEKTNQSFAINNSFDIVMHNCKSVYTDYILQIKASSNIRKNSYVDVKAVSIPASSEYVFHITKDRLYDILKNTTLTHVEKLTYKVLYKGRPITNSETNILYYFTGTEHYNLGYYDLSWALTGAALPSMKRLNIDSEVLCNILHETCTITDGSNKEVSLDVLESTANDPYRIDIPNVKTYYDFTEGEDTPETTAVDEENYSNLICRKGEESSPVLNYKIKFTLYNVSNRPKIVHYFAAHPNTVVLVDTRATENADDTAAIIPNIKSGTVSVTFSNATTTSEVSVANDSIKSDLNYDKYKYVTIPAHSSIEGEFTVSVKTTLEFSYWAITLAAKMFIALFLETPEGFLAVTSKGYANAFPWKHFIWRNYPTLPCDKQLNPYSEEYDYSPTVFSTPGYTNKNLNDEYLKLYNLQTLPKALSREYEAPSTGIRAYVLANQLEYFITNISQTPTKVLTETNIPIQKGNFEYYDNRVFVYNVPGYINTIYISNTDSFITPLMSNLDITFGNTITKLVPWRNYVIAFTKNSIHLISQSEDYGYTAKLINTSVGMPVQNKDTSVSVLNSIIFKSGTKIYSLIPNRFATLDTILNVTCISDSINSYLESLNSVKEFAFSTYDEYILCCVQEQSTIVFKYNYTTKIWTKHLYPIAFTDYKSISTDEIYVYVGARKYLFNKKLDQLLTKEVYDILPYGDYLDKTVDDLATYITSNPLISQSDCTPISFELEFRQKTSNYQIDKQFLESKLILAVESAKAVFPFQIDIVSDGMPRVVHVDANTDSPFWQDNLEQAGVLNTLFKSDTSNSESVLKQVFIKYSGKGKTITHNLYGNSNSKFTFYNINYRYRLLPKKQ